MLERFILWMAKKVGMDTGTIYTSIGIEELLDMDMFHRQVVLFSSAFPGLPFGDTVELSGENIMKLAEVGFNLDYLAFRLMDPGAYEIYLWARGKQPSQIACGQCQYTPTDPTEWR